MSQVDDILQQALALPPEDRAYVVAALEQSLTAPQPNAAETSASEDFLAELQRRSTAYRNGTSAARPAQDVLSDLRRRQAREMTQ